MTEEAANVRDDVKYQIECVVDDINNNLMILESIKQDRGRHGNLHNLLEIVKNIHKHREQDLRGSRTFHFPQHEPSFLASRVNYRLGSITKQEVVAQIPEVTEHLSTLTLAQHLAFLPPYQPYSSFP